MKHLNLRVLRSVAWLCVAAAMAAVPMGCFDDGPSTETGNPNLQGELRDVQGNPIPGTVRLFRLAATANPDSAALIPPALVRTLAVKADGRFAFDTLPSAAYALEGADAAGKTIALAPRLPLAGPKDTLMRTLILKAPARLIGMVTRGPNARPTGIVQDERILVRLGGTDRTASTDSNGRYALDNVPEGIYRIAFAAVDGHYEPFFLDSIAAAAGVTSELPMAELPWSRFQAPPAPAGLTVTVDSAAGTVRLAWRAVKLANLAYYEVARIDTLDPLNNAVHPTTDTFYVDNIKSLPAGRALVYRVTAVNALGNRSPDGPSQTKPAVVPLRPDTSGPALGFLSGVVRYKSAPFAQVKVTLYQSSARPGSQDSLPLGVTAVDSAVTGSDGRYRFGKLPPDSGGRYVYTVLAERDTVYGALKQGLHPRPDSLVLDTLEAMPAGSISGTASRDSLWVSAPFKADEGIMAGLAGTPFATLTGFSPGTNGSGYRIASVPPGRYRLVVCAPPEGYFLADTLDVTVLSGQALNVPAIKARYNPSAPPPKIATLRIASSTRTTVQLAWTPVPRYAQLKGYRVLRLDANRIESARSGVLTAQAYTDDVSGLASGSKWFYVVKVVSTAGKEGENGGDVSGQPIPFTVP